MKGQRCALKLDVVFVAELDRFLSESVRVPCRNFFGAWGGCVQGKQLFLGRPSPDFSIGRADVSKYIYKTLSYLD